MLLLNNDTGDHATRVEFEWPRGQTGHFVAWGTWDGATVSLEFTPDGGTTWVAMGTDTTINANGSGIFQCGRFPVRATIASAGPSTVLSAFISSLQT